MKTKKLFLPFVFALLMTTTLVFALSLRAEGGTINYIGSDTNLVSQTVKFSAWNRGSVGEGGLEIRAKTTTGQRVVLNLRLTQSSIIQDDANRLYTDNTARGTYWKTGSGRQIINLGTVRYDYNKNTGTVNVAGEGDINFRVTGMQITLVR